MAAIRTTLHILKRQNSHPALIGCVNAAHIDTHIHNDHQSRHLSSFCKRSGPAGLLESDGKHL